MAAEAAAQSGVAVDVYESKGSVGRKFLIAGKGGLNLTHSDDFDTFVSRYGARRTLVEDWLKSFDNEAIRKWARELGVETFVGTSGRIFPTDMKAAPLLRAWVRKLRGSGVTFHVNHRCTGFSSDCALTFETPDGESRVESEAVVFACGGASWPQLGSDGSWTKWFSDQEVAPLVPANCGFDVDWSSIFSSRYAGQPVKSVRLSVDSGAGQELLGEFVVTQTGVEGSAVYALGSSLRSEIERNGHAELRLDLLPDIAYEKVLEKISAPRKGRSLTEHLRRSVGLEGVKLGLLYESLPSATQASPETLASSIKSLAIKLVRPRPIEEAISTAGGVRLEALDESLMLRSTPGIFCAGEMLDWEAPTGGYLLSACFASGRVAGAGAAEFIRRARA